MVVACRLLGIDVSNTNLSLEALLVGYDMIIASCLLTPHDDDLAKKQLCISHIAHTEIRPKLQARNHLM